MADPRGRDVGLPVQRDKVGLPPRVFLYTLDQIATMLSVTVKTVGSYLWYDGRSTGVKSVHLMIAHNIAHPTAKPEWRVAERELVRWLKLKGFKYYEFGAVSA
jgi:hypothetical protein